MSTVEIGGTFILDTHNAILIDTGLDEAVWIPKSVVTNLEEVRLIEDKYVGLEVKEWFAEKEGLI
jgi:hypothetical protein